MQRQTSHSAAKGARRAMGPVVLATAISLVSCAFPTRAAEVTGGGRGAEVTAVLARPPADAALRQLIEADWIRQETNKTLAVPGNVTTQNDAAGGVDGVKNGSWGFHTSQDASPWWQVDLGSSQALDRVLIYNTGHEVARAVRLKVLLSADAKAWREAYAHDGTPFRGTPDNKPLCVRLNNAESRFVRIQLPGPQWLHLDEVEVFGQADPKRNIARGQPADQSSTSTWSTAKWQAKPGAVALPVEQILERCRRLADQRRQQGLAVDAVVREFDAVAASLKSLPVDPEASGSGRVGQGTPRPTVKSLATDPEAGGSARQSLYLQARWAVRGLLLADPLLHFDKLLFVKRITYQSSHIYTDHFDGSNRVGGNLCVLSPVSADGQVTEIVPSLDGGIFGRFDLSHDGRRIVFAHKKPGQGYRIYEVGVDGSGLRPLTQDGPDEAEMRTRFHHGYDDMDPCYLTDGRIMFVSTRSKRAVLCHNAFTCTALHVMDADGGNLHCVSGNTVNEFSPCVLDDGRVIYTRWEYIDKGCGDVQSLWAMRPDGTGTAHVYKNNVALPATLIDARSIPGSNRLVAIGAPHMPLAVGPVVLIDTRITQTGPEAMTNITPEIGYPGHAGYPGGKCGYYKEPYPLSEDLFLVSYHAGPNHDDPAGYGLYVLDRAGNRELIYRDTKFSCFQPLPLVPRPLPALAPVALGSGLGAANPAPPAADAPATLFLQDVYQGLTGIPRGTVKFLRVMEDVPKPWDSSYVSPANGDSLGLQNPAISLRGHFATKRVLGVAVVQPDGSAMFKVPAGKNLYFQALDENYMELQRMRTFVNLMPGEQRSCIGCHEPRTLTPTLSRTVAAALNAGPQVLQPQPGETGPRMVHYPTDVQPVLDKHCVRCHSGAAPKGELDLTGELTTLFCRSYENLINRKLVDNIDVDPRSARIPAEPPLSVGSHRSKMIARIRSGACSVQLTQPEFIRLATWIDANAPYYGVYEGKKNVKWKDAPDFRPPPALSANP